MSYTQGGNDGRTVTSIPLTDANPPGSASIGSLVRDATEQMSTLVRAEVALAKAEVTAEVRKGLTGSVFFILALTVLLFSSFFFFFFLAELLDVWLYRWAAFLIVFALMVLTTALLGFLGWLKVRKLRAPEKTIGSLKQTAEVLPQALTHRESAPALEKSTRR
ncbi:MULTISPECIES: phage holin family protein [unclassified Nocardia]|uniref:phage holin family protein n=1 Tax=Nocardia sp. NPDC056064 TaxID=3345701 RepID=UPI0035D802FB